MSMDAFGLVRELDFERLAGTDGEARALEVLVKHLKAIGLQYDVEPFELNGFECGQAELLVGGERFSVHPYGLETNREIEGRLRFAENADVLAYNLGAYRGCVVVSFTSSKRVADLLMDSGVAAYVSISAPHSGNLSLSHRQKLYEDRASVPSMTITYDDAERLIAFDGETARISISQDVRRREAHNLVVTVGEPKRDMTLTYLVAHYDSVARSHGSTDNAAGTACLMSCLTALADNPPEREVRAVFFSGEELGLRGSFAYVKAHAEEVSRRGRLVLNADVSGDAIGQDLLSVVGTKELMGYAGGVLREHGLLFRESLTTYSSDCMPFSVYEVPSLNLARSGGRGTHFIHTADDTVEHASPRGLATTLRALEVLSERVLWSHIYPVRKEIDDSLREKIERYLWQALREKPELKWEEKYRK